mmetsp:Transcript_10527/g.16743  ORF Transcript_10527/g.16743 Transcript_10527/m.16743 type:complete len:264 (+) Transcript_10527:447-1238(+)
MRVISTKLTQEFPNLQILNVTHRAHGGSTTGEPPHNFDATVNDLMYLFHEQEITRPDMIIGHSFGGKVALALTEYLVGPEADVIPPHLVYSLDSPPAKWDVIKEDSVENNESVIHVLKSLRDFPQPFTSKSHLLKEFKDRGFSEGLAQWMTLNVTRRGPNEFFWSFDLGAVSELFDAHIAADYLPFLDSESLAKSKTMVKFIQAGRNPAWEKHLVEHLTNHPNKHIGLEKMENVGHWLHAEDPNGLLQVMKPEVERLTAGDFD